MTCGSAQNGYSPPSGRLDCDPPGGLPFTGLDLLPTVGVALGLLIVGVALAMMLRRGWYA
jgi:hypothetical protein